MKILWIILLLSMSTAAALKWEQQTLNLKVHPTQVIADAVFCFTNVGETPVSITSVEVGCGCLEPKFNQKKITPGEQGELMVKFNLKNRRGPQKKTIQVKMDDGKEVRLSIKTDIPTSYNVVPKLMKWSADNRTPVKTVKLMNPNPSPIQLISVTSSHKNVTPELTVIRAGFEYELRVPRPVAEKNVRSVIRIKMEAPPGETESKDLKLYVLAE